MSGPISKDSSGADRAAADWLIAHDRGLTAEEQSEFGRWLEKPRHAQAWSEAQRAWARLDRMAELAPPVTASRRRQRRWPIALAAAAAVVLASVMLWPRMQPTAAPHAEIVRVAPRQMILSDGTRVDLNADSVVTEHFTPAERRVRLTKGEAHFTVTKNPARPFLVEAMGVAVRAVGTAFNVRLETSRIEVLVTHGQVSVGAAEAGAPATEGAAEHPGIREARPSSPVLAAGQRAVVTLASAVPAVEVSAVSSSEMSRALAWQALQLQFQDMPLEKVAMEFNRHNRTQLVVEPSAADTLVAGSFRAGNVEPFVRFLEEAFSVAAERRDDGTIVLRKAR